MTCRRDRFPKGLKEYLHHESGTGKLEKARAMQYEMPIVAIKQCPVPVNVDGKKLYTKTLVSFQSTGSTNLLGVNNLPGISLYVKKKERGNKTEKRTWGTEQMRQGILTFITTMLLTRRITR